MQWLVFSGKILCVLITRENVSCLSHYEICTTIIELLGWTHLVGNCVRMRYVLMMKYVAPINMPSVYMTQTCIKCS